MTSPVRDWAGALLLACSGVFLGWVIADGHCDAHLRAARDSDAKATAVVEAEHRKHVAALNDLLREEREMRARVYRGCAAGIEEERRVWKLLVEEKCRWSK